MTDGDAASYNKTHARARLYLLDSENIKYLAFLVFMIIVRTSIIFYILLIKNLFFSLRFNISIDILDLTILSVIF